MTQEQIEKLAEEEYTYDDEYAYNDPYSVQDRSITNALRNAFIKGYTTCQQTEIEPLQKEIERLKANLMELNEAIDNLWNTGINKMNTELGEKAIKQVCDI